MEKDQDVGAFAISQWCKMVAITKSEDHSENSDPIKIARETDEYLELLKRN